MPHPVVILDSRARRSLAVQWVYNAPPNTQVIFRKPGRSVDQNAILHAHLTDIARQPDRAGRKLTIPQWKALFLHACQHEVQWIDGLNGEAVPVGLSSSKLTKEQFTVLIDFIEAWCAERGIELNGPKTEAA